MLELEDFGLREYYFTHPKKLSLGLFHNLLLQSSNQLYSQILSLCYYVELRLISVRLVLAFRAITVSLIAENVAYSRITLSCDLWISNLLDE